MSEIGFVIRFRSYRARYFEMAPLSRPKALRKHASLTTRIP